MPRWCVHARSGDGEAFWDWLYANPELAQYMGSHAPENAFRAGWVNTFDLRLTQELPGFFEGHKSQDLGGYPERRQPVERGLGPHHRLRLQRQYRGRKPGRHLQVNAPGMTGKYVYGYRTGTEFGQATALGLPTNADGQTNGISQWSLQVGLKYEF